MRVFLSAEVREEVFARVHHWPGEKPPNRADIGARLAEAWGWDDSIGRVEWSDPDEFVTIRMDELQLFGVWLPVTIITPTGYVTDLHETFPQVFKDIAHDDGLYMMQFSMREVMDILTGSDDWDSHPPDWFDTRGEGGNWKIYNHNLDWRMGVATIDILEGGF